MMTRLKILFLCLFFATNTFAQSIPLQSTTLRIVPRYQALDKGLLGGKFVVVSQTDDGARITWYSIVKELDESGDYPTYKIKSKKGVLDVGGLSNKTTFLLPELWGLGYHRVERALPLWIDPAYLKLKGHEKRTFNVGLINNNADYLRQASPEAYGRLTGFQNLYDQLFVDGEPLAASGTKSDQRDLKKFAKEFFFAGEIAKTKASLLVNGTKQNYPALIIGNDYYNLVVIDDPLNPLVVSLHIAADKAPRLFQDVFNDFKQLFEFQVTQITGR